MRWNKNLLAINKHRMISNDHLYEKFASIGQYFPMKIALSAIIFIFVFSIANQSWAAGSNTSSPAPTIVPPTSVQTSIPPRDTVEQGGCVQQYTGAINSLNDQNLTAQEVGLAANAAGAAAMWVQVGAQQAAAAADAVAFTGMAAGLAITGLYGTSPLPNAEGIPGSEMAAAAAETLSEVSAIESTALLAGIAGALSTTTGVASQIAGLHFEQNAQKLIKYTAGLPNCESEFTGTVKVSGGGVNVTGDSIFNNNVGVVGNTNVQGNVTASQVHATQGISADGGHIWLGDPNGTTYSDGITLGGGALSGAGFGELQAFTGNINAIAIGNNAQALEAGGIALGQNASARSTGGIAIGQNASAESTGGIAIGQNAGAGSTEDIAIGHNTNTGTGGYNTAVGSGIDILGGGTNNTVLGHDHQVTGSRNFVAGDPNNVDGNANEVTGNNNDVKGDLNFVGGNDNHVGSIPDAINSNSNILIGNNNNPGSLAENNTIIGDYNNMITSSNNNIIGDGNTVGGGTQNNLIGDGSVAVGNSNTVIGNSAFATGNDAIAVGSSAVAQSNGGIAIGQNANALGTNSIAIGTDSFAGASVAVGVGAMAVGDQSAAFGDNAIALGNQSVAVGNQTLAIGSNSVALGNRSVANENNTVSVGSSGAERRVTNVADGINDYDAVNMRQFQSSMQKANIGIASVSALNAIPDIPSGVRFGVGAGYGYFEDESAVAIGIKGKLTEKIILQAGVGFGVGPKVSTYSANAGIFFGF